MTTRKSSTKRTVKSGAATTARTQKQKSTTETTEAKLARIQLLEKKLELQKGLPHLYGYKLYKWQRAYIDSTAKMNFICAANQIGKSVCNFIKLVHWATSPDLWPKLWSKRPAQFWYITVDRNFILREFDTKWSKEILPQGEYRDHPQYGWKAEYRNKYLHAIHFNSGITCYFATFEQDIHALQGSTVDAIFIDEEMPWSMIPELLLRIQRKDGYFNAVMTPTRGQEEWRCVFEERGTLRERFPEAFKQQISIYDCRVTEDGSPGLSDEYITKLLNRLGTQQEIDLRVYGKFVVSEGLKLPAFRRDLNFRRFEEKPKGGYWYSGVDIGGGGSGSLPAIVFLWVREDFKFARVTETWRGETTKIYTATDILDKYIEMRDRRPMVAEYYDFGAKDFGTFAHRAGVPMLPAEKSHEIGFPILNTLFKNEMLIIDENGPNHLLVDEIVNLREDQDKRRALDHLVDALRYSAAKVPWSLDGITGERIIPTPKREITQDDLRRGVVPEIDRDVWSLEEDMDFYNDMMDPDFF